MIVGRSKTIPGPYLDRKGNSMAAGGGTLLLQRNEDWYGVGHNSAYTFNGTDYIIFHGCDASDKGRPKLVIKELNWDKNGWPVVIDI